MEQATLTQHTPNDAFSYLPGMAAKEIIALHVVSIGLIEHPLRWLCHPDHVLVSIASTCRTSAYESGCGKPLGRMGSSLLPMIVFGGILLVFATVR